jgi:hypothetical protein
MKTVFLGFGGVLFSGPYMAAQAKAVRGHTFAENDAVLFDPACIARVNRVCSESGAEVVVTSSWRYGNGRLALTEMLRAKGFTGPVRGRLPPWDKGDTFVARERGDEIAEWLAAGRTWPDLGPEGSKVESYVVLDDCNDMTAVRDRLVQTSFETGITDADVARALEILARPWKPARGRRGEARR